MIQQDKIGQDLAVGDIVVVPISTSELSIAKVIKLTPKGARLAAFVKHTDRHGVERSYTSERVKRSSAIVKLTPDDAVMLKLKGII